LDDMFYYARVSLQHYAQWMLEQEAPYAEVKDKVLIWTETWVAQDIRKSCVLNYAAKYADESLRFVFLEKAEYFYSKTLKDLSDFETRDYTRPLSILMGFGAMHDYFQAHFQPFGAEPKMAVPVSVSLPLSQ